MRRRRTKVIGASVSLFDVAGHQVGSNATPSTPGRPASRSPSHRVASRTRCCGPRRPACTGGTAGSNPGVTVRVFPPGEHGPLTNAIFVYSWGPAQVTAFSPGAGGCRSLRTARMGYGSTVIASGPGYPCARTGYRCCRRLPPCQSSLTPTSSAATPSPRS